MAPLGPAADPPLPRDAQGSLSREQNARAALELADREGIRALSMRRLASELGVGTMTLYGYFRDKDELLDTAVDVAAAEMPLPPRSGDWKEDLRALWNAVQDTLADHPSGIHLRLRRPLISRGALHTTEAAMRILTEAGFSRVEADGALRVLFLFTFGHATFNPPSVPPETAAQWRAAFTELPEEFSVVPQMAPDLVRMMSGDEPFHYGLEVILDGLERRLTERSG